MSKIIYGPVHSRRFGRSLGVNILPLNVKTCTFDCVYCQLGRTENPKTSPRDLKEHIPLKRIIDSFEETMSSSEAEIDVVTISGNGEPTLHPELPQILDALKRKMREHDLDAPVIILTNSSLLDIREVERSLYAFDKVVAKLDTSDQEAFSAINRPFRPLKIDGITEQLRSLRRRIRGKLALQTMLIDSKIDGRVRNFGREMIERLGDVMLEIDPDEVELYTLDRAPAFHHVEKVEASDMRRAAEILSSKLGEDRLNLYL